MINFNLYIPTQDNQGKALSNSLQPIYAEKMSIHFGGMTSLKAQGGFISKTGLYIQEDIFILSSFGEMNIENVNFLNNLAKELKEVANQESVLITINNKPFFI